MNILLIDDDQMDAMMIQRALSKIAPESKIAHVKDGREGLDFVRTQQDQDALPSPYFILLDINMPRMNGYEFLRELRNSDTAAERMVFMFSSSNNPRDIEKAYQHGANGYFVKPQNVDAMKTIFGTLRDFWQNCEPPLSTLH